MLESMDSKIQAGTDWVKSIFEQVKQSHAIIYVIANGALVGLATTGYLAEKSIDPWSLTGGLYFLNFFTMLVILTIKVSATSTFLIKVMVMALTGFALQWETMGLIYKEADFMPFVEHPFAIFIFYAGVGGVFIYAFFTDVPDSNEASEIARIRAELYDARRKLAEFEDSDNNVLELKAKQC